MWRCLMLRPSGRCPSPRCLVHRNPVVFRVSSCALHLLRTLSRRLHALGNVWYRGVPVKFWMVVPLPSLCRPPWPPVRLFNTLASLVKLWSVM